MQCNLHSLFFQNYGPVWNAVVSQEFCRNYARKQFCSCMIQTRRRSL
uniref:Uncharacterized protein n=1 Tax=Arundo donax TaxID=35708 RepID=A0A0A8ZK27_ARUDO